MTRPDSGGLPDFDAFEWRPVDDEQEEPVVLAASRDDDLVPPAAPTDSGAPADVAAMPVGQGAHVPYRPPVGSPVRSEKRLVDIDAAFAYLVLLALSLGLTPLAEAMPVGRYTLLWTLLALVSVAMIVMRDRSVVLSFPRQELVWGAAWGLAVGLPLLLVGTDLLAESSSRIFVGMPVGAIFQTVVFVMAPAETVFFRYLLQNGRSISVTATMSAGWAILMFFPTMDVLDYPFVALIVGTFLVVLSLLYSHVRQRNGLAAAWLCHTIVSLAWLFVPRLL